MLQLELYETIEMTGAPLKRLRSGDQMEVLQREGPYVARVRLPDGETGWVKSLYLIDKEPARTRVNKLEAEIEAAQKKIDKLEQQLGDRNARLASLEASEEGSRELEQAVQTELETLRVQNEDMQSRLNAYVGNVPMSWLLVSLVVALVFGFTGGWYYIDRRSRARHGGYRVY
jgi:SH3 domain protein